MNDSNDDNENNKMNIKRYNYKVNSNSLITFEIKKQNHLLNTFIKRKLLLKYIMKNVLNFIFFTTIYFKYLFHTSSYLSSSSSSSF